MLDLIKSDAILGTRKKGDNSYDCCFHACQTGFLFSHMNVRFSELIHLETKFLFHLMHVSL